MPRRSGGTRAAPARGAKPGPLAGIAADEAPAERADAGQPEELSLEQRPSRRLPDEDEDAASVRTPRRDAMVLRQVKACIDRARPDTAGVTVGIERGVVVLEGRVADDSARRRILDLVSACSGVKLIRSRLRLVPG